MLLERDELLESLQAGSCSCDSRGMDRWFLSPGRGSGKSSSVRAFVESLDRSVLFAEGACDLLQLLDHWDRSTNSSADPGPGFSRLMTEDSESMEIMFLRS